MCFGKFICITLVGIIIYFVGFFSGAVMSEQIHDVHEKESLLNAERIRNERKLRYEKKHSQAEA